ncbi:PREDICTED: uncharacterized protein At5g23160-like [Populus euphratica]|uniref:Uncharacterized protein At5g23160-like n=1 Tax=Populus euphratica TaxID=75702 RepID=A0AAJ6VJ26_POPEU|nr:PREDICTED: uncharacterized protein At5g23160-like [Populus euphratica]
MLQTTVIMKNVSRNKFLLCFKPVVDMDQLVLNHSEVGVVDHSTDKSLKHLPREKKKRDHMMRLVPNSSLLSDDNDTCSAIISSSENSLILHSSKKNLSRVIKAVFFDTILAKRIHDRKGNLCQDSNIGSKPPSSSSSSPPPPPSMDSKKSLDDTSDHDNTNLVNKVLIDTHQANEVTSCPSSISESRKLSKIKNSRNPNELLEFKAKTKDKSGIYLFLVSLAVTVLWGKLCAIFFTITWLYFLPRRQHSTSRPQNVTRSLWLPEKEESKDQYYYKKKVIMEGLLERNHQRVNGIKFLT